MNFDLSNQAFFPTWPKSHDKDLNILRTKRTFKMKWKAFFIIFKGLLVKQITQSFLELESPTLNLYPYFFSKFKKFHPSLLLNK